MERERLLRALQRDKHSPEFELHVCGFGQIAAAARASMLIAKLQPTDVTLVGIAGRLTPKLELGEAYDFASVTCDGIGVGSGATFCSAEKLGWPQFVSDPSETIKIGDRLTDLRCLDGTASGELLSVCAASANTEEAATRRERFPHAIAEEMEGFGVALACVLASVPLRIIRGISNDAGHRVHRDWNIDGALAQAASLLKKSLE